MSTGLKMFEKNKLKYNVQASNVILKVLEDKNLRVDNYG